MTRNGPQWSDIDEQAVDPALNYLFEERERWVESIYNPPTICAHRLLCEFAPHRRAGTGQQKLTACFRRATRACRRFDGSILSPHPPGGS
jgi:hypothetical protein